MQQAGADSSNRASNSGSSSNNNNNNTAYPLCSTDQGTLFQDVKRPGFVSFIPYDPHLPRCVALDHLEFVLRQLKIRSYSLIANKGVTKSRYGTAFQAKLFFAQDIQRFGGSAPATGAVAAPAAQPQQQRQLHAQIQPPPSPPLGWGEEDSSEQPPRAHGICETTQGTPAPVPEPLSS